MEMDTFPSWKVMEKSWNFAFEFVLEPWTYSDTSAELVEARGVWQVLDMFETFTTTPEQPVNVSELLKSPARNTKANYE